MVWSSLEAAREYHRNYYRRRRQPMLDYLGGKCADCGSTEELQFDHIDPREKSFEIKANLTLNNPEVRAELDKCQLLCKPCHLRKSAKERSGFTHGTMYAWMAKRCRCEVCFPAWRSWHDERNARRRKRGGVAER